MRSINTLIKNTRQIIGVKNFANGLKNPMHARKFTLVQSDRAQHYADIKLGKKRKHINVGEKSVAKKNADNDSVGEKSERKKERKEIEGKDGLY